MADGQSPPKRMHRSPEARIAAEIEAAKALRAVLAADAEDAELYADMIEGETSLFEMIDAVYANIQLDQELLDGIKARENDLAIRKARVEERIGWRKAKIEQAILIFGEKIERPEATFSLAQRQPKLIVSDDESQIPTRFFKTSVELDKAALLKAIKAGEVVEGASLSNAPQTLTIRRK